MSLFSEADMLLIVDVAILLSLVSIFVIFVIEWVTSRAFQ